MTAARAPARGRRGRGGVARRTGALLWSAVLAWSEDRATTLGAALAFYTIFSLGPVMLVVVAMAGALFGSEAATGAIFDELSGLLGPQGAEAVQKVIDSAATPAADWIGKAVGPIAFLVSATAVFTELQSTLNAIWRVSAARFSIWSLVRVRAISFALIMAAAFVLTVSLVINAGVVAFGDMVLGDRATVLAWILQTIVSIAVITLIFTLILKIMPDGAVPWRAAAAGALVAAILFTVGKSAIGLYLGQTDFASTYGAAGAFILVLLWVYYSSLIFLFGAEVSHAFAATEGTAPGQRTGKPR